MEFYNDTFNYCQQYADNNICELDEEKIMRLYEFDKGHLGNVIRGMEDECFGLFYYEEKDKELFLFFVKRNTNISLTGLSMVIPLFSKYRNIFVFFFSKVLVERYSFNKKDECSIANTYQHLIKTACEQEGFLTENKEQLRNDGVTLVMSHRPILDVTFFKRDFFFEQYFNSKLIEYALQNEYEAEEKVYIMFNSRSLLYKIGYSTNPKRRERTLQGEDPELKLIACWITPKETEKELHNLFAKKRTRGEWFRLNLKDLEKIRNYMEQYNPFY